MDVFEHEAAKQAYLMRLVNNMNHSESHDSADSDFDSQAHFFADAKKADKKAYLMHVAANMTSDNEAVLFTPFICLEGLYHGQSEHEVLRDLYLSTLPVRVYTQTYTYIFRD